MIPRRFLPHSELESLPAQLESENSDANRGVEASNHGPVQGGAAPLSMVALLVLEGSAAAHTTIPLPGPSVVSPAPIVVLASPPHHLYRTALLTETAALALERRGNFQPSVFLR